MKEYYPEKRAPARTMTIAPGSGPSTDVEIARKEMRFGRIAHVTSVYETRLSKDGPLLKRGINSLQLLWEGERWWIVSVIWDNERVDNPLPADLLE